jgi:integrase
MPSSSQEIRKRTPSMSIKVTSRRSRILISRPTRTSKLVFPREDGQPDGYLLRDLRGIANRVRIDPKRAKLHSFRRTGATKLLQKGLPLQEVMALGGWRRRAAGRLLSPEPPRQRVPKWRVLKPVLCALPVAKTSDALPHLSRITAANYFTTMLSHWPIG